MANPTGLFRRRGSSAYYIQRRYPLELAEAAGKPHFKRSLRTSDRAVAIRRCNAANVEFDEECERLRAQLNGTPFKASVWTLDQAKQLIRRYVSDQTAKMQADFTRGDPDGILDWREDCLQESAALINFHIAPECDEAEQDIHNVARQIFGLPLPPWPWEDDHDPALKDAFDVFGDRGPLSHLRSCERTEIHELIRRALLEFERRSSATLRSDFRRPYFDHAFSLASEVPPAATDKARASLSLLASDYLTEYPKTHSTKAKRSEKVAKDVALITEFFGPDTPVVSIDRKRCREFRDLLNDLPSNLNKHFPNRVISLCETITEAKRRHLPQLKYNTQAGYLGTMKDLAAWARREGYAWNAEVSDLKPIGEKQHKSDARNPFTADQLTTIFNAPIYWGSIQLPQTMKNSGVSQEARYWIPLLSLLTGMRLNEICQLGVGDLKREENGLIYIDVNALEGGKSLKTRYAERLIPLHSELIRLGFVEFVQRQQNLGNKRVFADLKRSTRGYYSEEFSKWFGRTFLRSRGAQASKTSFHSFRHNFRDALRNAGVSTEIAQALGGWSSGEGVSENYGDRNSAHSLKKLHESINLINYETTLQHVVPFVKLY